MVEGDVLVVDVRTKTEYKSGYIPEANNVPLDQIEKSFKNLTENKDDTILVYCRS
ncbi:MAG: rhodanese-like domain-containing protein [Clostridiales bacterium]|nr:rhodanese-like domain-containing protein [Clostridiales bacterium]